MLSFSNYRQDVDEIIQAVLTAVDPAAAVAQQLIRDGRALIIKSESVEQQFDLDKGRVFLVSAGKAAIPMGTAVAEKIADNLTYSLFVTKKRGENGEIAFADTAFDRLPSPFVLIEAGHPVPNEESVRAGTAVFNLLAQTTADDLVIFCISGGTSALLSKPRIPLTDWQALTAALLSSGCSISDFNRVRRQLDEVKGGGLAAAAAPAACITLILSDVAGNDLAAVGSGPTVFMRDEADEALTVLARYEQEMGLETAVYTQIIQTIKSVPSLTPPPTLHNIIIADGGTAALAALRQAAQLGFLSQILTTHLEGEAREAGRMAAAMAKDLPAGNCLILGGETTVTLQGDGIGGRNQETALAAAIALDGWHGVVIASFATDGEDGVTTAAGGVVTGGTVENGRAAHLDPHIHLQNNDSHPFLRAAKSLINTGLTNTNVNDLILILSYPLDSDVPIYLSTEEE